MKKFGVIFALAAVCSVSVPVAPPVRAQGGADFSRTIFVGDSLTAGFQSGALHEGDQINSFPVLVGAAINTPVIMPTIAFPGIPTPNPSAGQGLMLIRSCNLGEFDIATGVTTGRVDPSALATDVAIPGHNMAEAATSKWAFDLSNPSTVDSLEDFILGFPYALQGKAPATQVETAVGLQPTFVVAWLGSNDALGAALSARVDDTVLTPVPTFNAAVETVFDPLQATGAKGVILNVPDVTVIPNLFSVAEISALSGFSAANLKTVFGIKPGDFVPLSALPALPALQPLTENQVLTKKEVKAIQKNIKAYNKKLKAKAAELGWAYIDVNTILNGYAANGVQVAGAGKLTTNYLGGLFSLDGVHPSNTGHSLLATEIIRAINSKYGTSFPLPNVAAIAADDPFVCQAGNKAPLTLDEVLKALPAVRAAELVILGENAR